MVIKYIPHIGKNVIEILTLGMYENPRFIYREYVQNAADQIDIAVEDGILDSKSDGEINIYIDKIQKTIIIEDNATGISSDQVLKFLGDVANSQKDSTKRKGFRGIGRLGGLGYCDKLVFETSFIGESTKSIITLNAKLLKDIISNKSDSSDAATVISAITTLDKIKTNRNEHYFKVKLINVTNEELLNKDDIKNYLSMVGPLPFNEEFIHKDSIHSYFGDNHVKIEEYDVHLKINDEKLYKAYKTEIVNNKSVPVSKIIGIDFFNLKNEDGELLAICWYGISNLLNKTIHSNNLERGLRIRKNNIQIGSEDTLNSFFTEPRFNHHYIGEIYVVHTSFIPNARRDYFNENKNTKIFERLLKQRFAVLYKLAHRSSEIHSRIREIKNWEEKNRKFSKEEFISELLENQYRKGLATSYEKAIRAGTSLDNMFTNHIEDKALMIVYNYLRTSAKLPLLDKKDPIPKNRHYDDIILSQLNDNEQQIVDEIFSIIERNLPLLSAEMLKKKISDRFK